MPDARAVPDALFGPAAPVEPEGPVLFARFAYPPNALGYCGPADSRALLEYTAAGVSDGGLRELARCFDGAWPYLQLIAGANGLTDPLDARVVEAYWIGNRLLDRVPLAALGATIEERLLPAAGMSWPKSNAVPAGAVPHHSFHVLGVSPWLGLLSKGVADGPLHVLDRCRVRWGRVEALLPGRAVVVGRSLVWDGCRLALGPPRQEEAVMTTEGLGLAGELRPGDWCALHWDWVCTRLSPRQLRALRRCTTRQLAVCNGLASDAS